MRGNHLAHPAGSNQAANARVRKSSVVTDDGEVFGAGIQNQINNFFGCSAAHESTEHDADPIMKSTF